MTFFTNDTCYNLALVTVLALITLYLIGKFFSEEEFTVYFKHTEPIQYENCIKDDHNSSGSNPDGYWCDDSVVQQFNYSSNKPVTSQTYYEQDNHESYNNCVNQGGTLGNTSSGNNCTLVTKTVPKRVTNKFYYEKNNHEGYNNCVNQGGILRNTPNGNACQLNSSLFCNKNDIIVENINGINKCCNFKHPYLNRVGSRCCKDAFNCENNSNMTPFSNPSYNPYTNDDTHLEVNNQLTISPTPIPEPTLEPIPEPVIDQVPTPVNNPPITQKLPANKVYYDQYNHESYNNCVNQGGTLINTPSGNTCELKSSLFCNENDIIVENTNGINKCCNSKYSYLNTDGSRCCTGANKCGNKSKFLSWVPSYGPSPI